MADRYWQWSLTQYKHGAADEVEEALTKLLLRDVIKLSPASLHLRCRESAFTDRNARLQQSRDS